MHYQITNHQPSQCLLRIHLSTCFCTDSPAVRTRKLSLRVAFQVKPLRSCKYNAPSLFSFLQESSIPPKSGSSNYYTSIIQLRFRTSIKTDSSSFQHANFTQMTFDPSDEYPD